MAVVTVCAPKPRDHYKSLSLHIWIEGGRWGIKFPRWVRRMERWV